MNRLRKTLFAPLLVLTILSMGGCAAILPTLLSSAVSFVVPKSVSLAMTGLRTIQKIALIAADERSLNDMAKDKILSIKASANLLSEPQSNVEAYVYNSDIYVVGEVDSLETRNRIITDLREIKGVRDVKGVLKERPPNDYAPNVSDAYLENIVQLALTKQLHIRSANIEAEACQGEIFILGVVENKQEEFEIMEYVRGISNNRVTSLICVQDEYESGMLASNYQYILRATQPAPPQDQTLFADADGPVSVSMQASMDNPAEHEILGLNITATVDGPIEVVNPLDAQGPVKVVALDMSGHPEAVTIQSDGPELYAAVAPRPASSNLETVVAKSEKITLSSSATEKGRPEPMQTSISLRSGERGSKYKNMTLFSELAAPEQQQMSESRAQLSKRLLSLAKDEADPKVKIQLIRLASAVSADGNAPLDVISKAANSAEHGQAQLMIKSILVGQTSTLSPAASM